MSDTPALSDRREALLLVTLAGVQFTHIMDFMVLAPLGPQLMRVLHISPQQFGLLVSCYMLSAALVGLAAAFRIDRFDRKRTLLTTFGGFSLATLLCALAPGYTTLLACRAIAGGFGGVLGATVFAIIGDLFPEARRGQATGTVMSAFGLATVAGVPTGLVLASVFNWRAPFLLITLLNGAILVAAWRLLPAVSHHLHDAARHGFVEQLRAVFGPANHRKGFALGAIIMFGSFSVIPFISPYMVANVGLTEAQLPYVYLSGGLATLFTGRAIGKLADRHGKRHVFAIVALISIIPVLIVTHLPPGTPVALAVANGTVFMIFVSGRGVVLMAMMNALVESRLRGSFMGFSSAIQQLAAATGTYAAGLIIGKNAAGQLTHYGTVGWIAMATTLVAVLIATRFLSLPAAAPR